MSLMSWLIWSNSLAAGSGAVGLAGAVGDAGEGELPWPSLAPLSSEPDAALVSKAANEA